MKSENRRRIKACALPLAVATAISVAVQGLAGTRYASHDSPNPTPPYLTRDTAAHTIQQAYDDSSAGDTVIVANGIYANANQDDVLRLDKSGAPGEPITVEATNVGGAILDGQGLKGSDGYEQVVYITGNYNVMRGFEIRRGYDGGVDIWGSHNQILQCNIHNNGDFGDTSTSNGLCGICDQPNTAGNTYIGNYIHDNGRISQRSNLDHGIYLQGTNNEVVINNLIARNCAFGIHVAADVNIANMEIANNTIVSNLNRGGIMLWGNGGAMSGIEITNNLIYGNAEPGIMTSSCTGSGVRIVNNHVFDNSGHGLSGPWDMNNNQSKVSYVASGNITNSDREFLDNADALAKLFSRH
jgi:hypothetical protein